MTRPIHGGNLAWAAALAGCSPSTILDFSASINPLGPPASAIAAIQAHFPNLRHYPDPSYGELRQVLGQWHGLPPDWILPGNGAAELLTWIGRDLSHLAATYLVTPAFSDYFRALQTFDACVLRCPLHDFQDGIVDFAAVSAQFPKEQDRKTAGLLLNNPHNPTGQLFLRSAIAPFLSQFALVVVDEAFMDFLPPEQQQSLIAEVENFPNLVILRSLTKFYSLPGLRLGYAIAHPDRLRRWQQWRDPWSVNVLAIAAGIASIQDTAFQHQTWHWLAPARTQLFEGFAQLPGLSPCPSAANYLLVRSDWEVPQLQLQLLQQQGILIRDCLSFPELGDRYFRVAVRLPAENQRLLEGLAAVIAAA